MTYETLTSEVHYPNDIYETSEDIIDKAKASLYFGKKINFSFSLLTGYIKEIPMFSKEEKKELEMENIDTKYEIKELEKMIKDSDNDAFITRKKRLLFSKRKELHDINEVVTHVTDKGLERFRALKKIGDVLNKRQSSCKYNVKKFKTTCMVATS